MESNFDDERYSCWTGAFMTVQFVGQPVTHENNSHWLWIAEVARGLARIDAKLVIEDRWAASLLGREGWSEAEWNRYKDHIAVSQLWVMGAYELLRTVVEEFNRKELDEKNRHQKRQKTIKKLNKRQGQKRLHIPPFKPDPLLSRAQCLLKEFVRLRIPMAKLQSAKAFMADNPIARPGISEKGIGWTTGENMFVTRMELADRMIDVLDGYSREEIEEKWRSLNLLMQGNRLS